MLMFEAMKGHSYKINVITCMLDTILLSQEKVDSRHRYGIFETPQEHNIQYCGIMLIHSLVVQALTTVGAFNVRTFCFFIRPKVRIAFPTNMMLSTYSFQQVVRLL